jgi:hypothetical protein
MEKFIVDLVKAFDSGKVDRREFCQTVALAAAVYASGEAAHAQAARGFKVLGGGSAAPRNGLRREQWRPFRPGPLSHPAGGQAGFLSETAGGRVNDHHQERAVAPNLFDVAANPELVFPLVLANLSERLSRSPEPAENSATAESRLGAQRVEQCRA